MVPPNETLWQPLASPRAWCPEHGTSTRQLVAASDVPVKNAYNARPLAKTATSAEWLYVAITVLPEHSKWTFCKPQDSESVTKLCTIDSMRTAFTADDQHVVAFSPRNTVELDFTLPRIINIGSCVTGVPSILFTDESKFHVSTCDRRVSVWRRAGEQYADRNIVEYERYGGGSVMVSGSICLDG